MNPHLCASRKLRLSVSPGFFEQLEPRRLFAGTPAPAEALAIAHAQPAVVVAKPAAATIATTAKLSVSAPVLTHGQTLTVTVKVTPKSGSAMPVGSVELFEGKARLGAKEPLNHMGRVTFTFNAGNALFLGTYSFSVKYLGSAKFAARKSKAVGVSVVMPKLTALADGLQVATVVAGSGKEAKAGQTLVVQYTGYYGSTGVIFDESSVHTPPRLSYVLDAPMGVIAGFNEGTTGMKVGETRVIVVPSALGYQDGQLRVFVVHLLSLE